MNSELYTYPTLVNYKYVYYFVTEEMGLVSLDL